MIDQELNKMHTYGFDLQSTQNNKFLGSMPFTMQSDHIITTKEIMKDVWNNPEKYTFVVEDDKTLIEKKSYSANFYLNGYSIEIKKFVLVESDDNENISRDEYEKSIELKMERHMNLIQNLISLHAIFIVLIKT